jgi:hypothetical protein
MIADRPICPFNIGQGMSRKLLVELLRTCEPHRKAIRCGMPAQAFALFPELLEGALGDRYAQS